MINHARTLLVNRPPVRADYVDGGYDGYEYIAPNFKPVTLPSRLLTLRKMLFGSNPDGLFVGLRARELMSYIHQTELAEYVYALDSRVTYWPEMKEASAADKQLISIAQTYGSPRRVIPVGELSAIVSTGISYKSYSVVLGAENAETTSAFVRIKMLETPYTITSTLVTLPTIPIIPLPQNNISIKIAETNVNLTASYLLTESNDTLIIETFGAAGTPLVLEGFGGMAMSASVTPLAHWQISTRAKPPAAITTLLPSLEILGESVFLELFGVKPAEPYATFKNLWFDHPLPMYRLAGLVLALIYRTEEIRAKNG